MKIKLVFIVLLTVILQSQTIDKKWVIIQDIDDRIVYLDTSTLKMMNNQISAWTNIYYREPIELSPFQPKARSVKSQFLINPVTRKFQVIGSIYYDDKGAMVSESSNSRFGIGNFQSDVDDVSGMEIVLEKAQEYLNNGKITSSPSQVDFSSMQKPTTQTEKTSNPDSSKTLVNDSEQEKGNDFYRINKSGKVVYTSPPDIASIYDNSIEDKTEIKFETDEDSKDDSVNINKEQISSVTEVQPESYTEPVIDEKPIEVPVSENQQESISDLTPKQTLEEKTYNIDNEQNVTNTIFTDGNLFLVQISSWKTSSVAKNEVQKLINKGFNAFIHEVYIPSKKANYNRVRVGFFSSLSEAQEAERKIK
ncbi:MAG: hypothetical protein CMF23_12770 [Ignavibacteriae bacterium]|nr:hypothetical protein [Ignavibacteriota bacterium]